MFQAGSMKSNHTPTQFADGDSRIILIHLKKKRNVFLTRPQCVFRYSAVVLTKTLLDTLYISRLSTPSRSETHTHWHDNTDDRIGFAIPRDGLDDVIDAEQFDCRHVTVPPLTTDIRVTCDHRDCRSSDCTNELTTPTYEGVMYTTSPLDT